MKLILIILFLIPIVGMAQTKFNTPIPVIYWYSDTSTTWSTGTFKYSTALNKRKGYVVYKDSSTGITYSYLDANKQAINKNYMVLYDNKNSQFINYRGTVFPNAVIKKGTIVDTVYTKQ